MNEQKFKNLIETYLARVAYALELFRTHQGIDDLTQWRRHGLPRIGFITPTISYSFHGVGCRVETAVEAIDWDFGHNGRTDGFDLWRLQNFADEHRSLFGSITKEELSTVFNEAILSGLICKPENDPFGHLYYAGKWKNPANSG